jgi:predicted nucleic acid-binding protein
VSIFCDTSALFAVLDGNSELHSEASRLWASLSQSDQDLITTNYIVVELISLLQRRSGIATVRKYFDTMTPALHVHWVDEFTHRRAEQALLTAQRRHLSLVDCVSFDVMRQLGVSAAFEFDGHFAEQGFTRYAPV